MKLELCMMEIRGLGAVTITLTNFSINCMNVSVSILYRWFVVQLGFLGTKLCPSYVYMIVHCFLIEWYDLLCEWGKVGRIVCVSRVETLQVSPKRVHLA